MTLLGKLIVRVFMARAKAMRASQFDVLPRPHGRVVFLGDSITEQANWHEWFPDVPLVNRGSGGDTTAGVLDRLDTAIDNPRAVFLLIGTNDVVMGVPQQEITANLDAIAAGILRDVPEAPLFIQSVMPRGKRYADRLRNLNREYQTIAEKRGATYLDLWPALSGPEGQIQADFSLDSLHLNGPGYRAWTDVLRPFVESV